MLPVLIGVVVAGCAAVDPERLGDGAAAVDAEMRRLEQRGFAGQVVIAHGQQALLVKGYGSVQPGSDAPIDADSVMPLASLTKAFTASAVLAMAADGRLSLADPVGRYVPDLAAPWAGLPIDQLMTHSAGLPAEIINRNWAGHPQFEPVDRETFINRIQHFPPDPLPGAAFNYSNLGYGLLAVLIETVSGKSYEKFLHQRLLHPAEVREIGFLIPQWAEIRRVHGRENGRDWGSYFDRPRLEEGLGFLLRGSGDLHASGMGVLSWWRALQQRRWLAEDWMERWLQPRVNEPDGSRYGYGLNFRETPFGTAIGHTGGNRVYSADLSWWPEHELMVYIASAEAHFDGRSGS
ncbi:MAG: serine hydrolase domain-containing protein [Wenzhouxiangellaceae bacterium]|nr:serine hydrolase domain-containing protein [Wenzhouxiangellaceae bacterium]